MKDWQVIVLCFVFALIGMAGMNSIHTCKVMPVADRQRVFYKLGYLEYDGLAFTVTAYCPCEVCCGRFSDGITASGHIIQPGDKFAAAPPEVPYGTMLDIPGYGVVPVLDRGGSIKGNRLDVFFSDHETALKWGAQKLEVKFK